MKNRKGKKTVQHKTIQDLTESRTGGQVALRGYSYQLLYSCFLILSMSSDNNYFHLEGTEDIDSIIINDSTLSNTHIQLKYSKNKQDASYLKDVLKNYLEVYLLDQNRRFKLVYDFPVANGNLKKLFSYKLDETSKKYWSDVILRIREDTPLWNWGEYDFETFISKLSFEHIKKDILEEKITQTLISKYNIINDNISLFANSIKVLCFEKMENRDYLTRDELENCIQLVKFDISKGEQNPAHSWIHTISFSDVKSESNLEYYEGKKATPLDIVNGLPVERPIIESQIINSIQNNWVTVIKASSGQGKTTLALKALFKFKDEYMPYQLTWCGDTSELGNIVQYFKSRISVGEKPIILVDNLDANLKNWNELAQLMQLELPIHWKMIVTSREPDWYYYSGDLSNIQLLNIIKPMLSKEEAKSIFVVFKKNNRVHKDVQSWESAWNRIAGRKLLIEYIYLLTHGVMLSERISSQMLEVSKSSSGKIKLDILRKVSFADICGIRLSIPKLFDTITDPFDDDLGELLKSMNEEFLVTISDDKQYIEGLHPIRSKHIFNRLHEILPVDATALSVISIADSNSLPILFSHLPEFIINDNAFFVNIVEMFWNQVDLSKYISIIQGLFSGGIMQYFISNEDLFNDANNHGGLLLFSTEVCPYSRFKEFNIEVDTLDKMLEIFPDNQNIIYLKNLVEKCPEYDLKMSYLYVFCKALYEKLQKLLFVDIIDYESYSIISEWIYNIDNSFNLSSNIILEHIWDNPKKYSQTCIANLMYLSYAGNKDRYLEFTDSHLDCIIDYLKQATNSQKLYIEEEKEKIHVEYLLRLEDIKKSNDESVSRIKAICKTLPVFKCYCADSIMPQLDILSSYKIPNDAHKEMPINNVVIMFHQDLISLWNKSIMSNYECDSVSEWIRFWIDTRRLICSLINVCCACIYKILESKNFNALANEFDELHKNFTGRLIREVRYPKQDRPFEEKTSISDDIIRIKNSYFQIMQNFFDQFAGLIKRDTKIQRIALINLTKGKNELKNMQKYFEGVVDSKEGRNELVLLSNSETQLLNTIYMDCSYYQNHSPDLHFRKHCIKKWFFDRTEAELKNVENGLDNLNKNHLVTFPQKTYSVDILTYYPIILDDFDSFIYDNEGNWIYDLISFADSAFDYLVLVGRINKKVLQPTAIQISKNMLKDIKKAIATGDDSVIDSISPPYPIDVTNEIVNCFDDEVSLSSEGQNSIDALSLGNIAEELWMYSKLREILSDENDNDYLKASQEDIKNRISDMLDGIKSEVSNDTYKETVNICSHVFDEEDFDNYKLNEFLNGYINSQLNSAL